ncbi:hypothetical protein [Christensenella intestinihominis]|uniref:hypothetical protein n=1 Tax=Christensenella intestinihominis TaxID=1851429 RepID=UPI00082B136E|nr:hypothetical protein [Christensenella intestinihominis]
MKIKLCCIICAVLAAFLFYGCMEETGGPVATASVSTVQEEERTASPSPAMQEAGEAWESADPEGTTVTGEFNPEAAGSSDPPSAQEAPGAFIYSERYEGDGYAFYYPKGTEILSDEETVKSFLLPGKEYALNVTRLNLSGQDVTLSQALPVYKKALEDRGNTITETGTVDGFPYENALLEGRMKEGNSAMDSVQVFFLAEDYHYTFTVSSHGGDMDIMKEIITEIVKSFTAD